MSMYQLKGCIFECLAHLPLDMVGMGSTPFQLAPHLLI